jgi:hypothetical protein
MHSYHLNRKISQLAILEKWAMDIAQPYLTIHKTAELTMAITDPREACMNYNEQDPMDLEEDQFDKLLRA